MILVTGAAGHLGNVLVRELVSRGEDVRALLLPGEDRTPLADLPIEQIEADILDYPALDVAFQGIDTVYHLAGIISILPGQNPVLRMVNVLGTRNVIHAALEHGVRRMVYTSSIHALRRLSHGIVIDEKVPFDPEAAISSYDQSKAQASLEVLKAVPLGLNAVIACPTGIIGPYDFRLSEMGKIILDCLERKPQLYVDGAYDFVDVRDVAEGLILANQQGKRGETYILSGEQLTVRRLLDSIRQITGNGFLRICIPFRLAQLVAKVTPLYYRLSKTKPRFTPYSLETLASNSVISFEKARRELGYSPRPLSTTIADTIRWFIQNKSLLPA